ncbi:pisatin demethylase [Colletotrichum spaethianum]|uniref:Pisatin demethylase n=1 Tax=Colletotrichum spaethianum TaxID=700344 RepID=A0AA37PES7_9PEZI|nr:pisatin demethylase [Colletotrichum spaethianum]GKT50770.1 pisatin demethylase [Colletotrichum spaethianum]
MESPDLFTSIASNPPGLQTAVYVLAGLICAFYIVRPFLSPLRSVPGPFLARYTDAWFLWRLHRGHIEQDFLALHRKHGAIVRYGPSRYSIKHLEAPKIIYGHGHPFVKSSFYRAYSQPELQDWNTFAVENTKVHSQLRRQLQSAYSLTALVSYEPYVDECARILKQRLQEVSVAGLPINFAHWLQCYAFDVIGMITYGSRFGFLDHGEDVHGIISAIDTSLYDSSHLSMYPSLRVPAAVIRRWLSRGKSGLAFVTSFAQQNIDNFRANSKTATGEPEKEDSGKMQSFLEKFFLKHEADPATFTLMHLLSGCRANVMAGSDTTGSSLSAVFYYLMKRPDCYQKLREEVDAVQPSQTKDFIFRETLNMPYLQAVIKEALRVHPAFGTPLERVVPEGGATIAGRFFSAGIKVSVHCWVENRNELIFEDPDEFRPERWLVEDENKLALMNRHWIPFGLGTRTCIGRHISMLEISKLVPRIVRDFDFRLQERADESWETKSMTFVKPKNFMVTVKARTG